MGFHNGYNRIPYHNGIKEYSITILDFNYEHNKIPHHKRIYKIIEFQTGNNYSLP